MIPFLARKGIGERWCNHYFRLHQRPRPQGYQNKRTRRDNELAMEHHHTTNRAKFGRSPFYVMNLAPTQKYLELSQTICRIGGSPYVKPVKDHHLSKKAASLLPFRRASKQWLSRNFEVGYHDQTPWTASELDIPEKSSAKPVLSTLRTSLIFQPSWSYSTSPWPTIWALAANKATPISHQRLKHARLQEFSQPLDRKE